MFPSDHFVADVGKFRDHVRRAAELAARRPEKIVLLRTEPEWADPRYGYIVPGEPVTTVAPGAAFVARAFCEKPPPPIAARVVATGALWNCFVMVCRVERLLALARALRPHDVGRPAAALGDAAALADTYAGLPAWNFSSKLLAHITEHLFVLRATTMARQEVA